MYNESLVKRGEVLLDFDVIDNWDTELEKMNEGKEGRKFAYPDSFIKLLGYMRAYFHLPYRQTEGVVREHASSTLPSIPDYSNISRRINRLNIKINDDDDDDKSSLQYDDYFVIAIDSTGIKVSNRGEWIRHKWNVKRGYLKIHVAVDIKKKRILSLQVTSEQVHDGKVLPQLIDDITIKQNKVIDTAIMDGSYDSNKNFQLLSFRGINPAIKVRKNSRCKNTNHYLRNKTVKMQKKNNLQQWKDSVSYGQRWIAETVFSCIKRMFGEYVTAIRFENMVKEMILKASLYNWFQSIAIR
jgi:Transposase DDE domain